MALDHDPVSLGIDEIFALACVLQNLDHLDHIGKAKHLSDNTRLLAPLGIDGALAAKPRAPQLCNDALAKLIDQCVTIQLNVWHLAIRITDPALIGQHFGQAIHRHAVCIGLDLSTNGSLFILEPLLSFAPHLFHRAFHQRRLSLICAALGYALIRGKVSI